MEHKPTSATGYSPESTELARQACLYLATKLGDLLDEVVIVGGLVPSLIVPPTGLPRGRLPHIGTLDVDIGLGVAILDDQKYHELEERLRGAGFVPDVNSAGKPTSQRRRIATGARSVTVDFLIPPTAPSDRGGRLRNFEEGFAAVIMPGLELAFQDREEITLTGETLHGEQATRLIRVCGAGAFTVLKALAFRGRGENKDAYDLIYVLQNYGSGIEDVFHRLESLLESPPTLKALEILQPAFREIDSVGTIRAAAFLGDAQDDAVRADAAGVVRSLLRLCGRYD